MGGYTIELKLDEETLKTEDKSNYNFYTDRIIKVLRLSKRRLNTSDISYYSKMNIVTARKYLYKLFQNKKVKKNVVGSSVYWELRK